MSTFFTLLAAGMLSDNIALHRLFSLADIAEPEPGIKPLLKKCGLLSALLFLSGLITYPIIKWVLIPLNIQYFSTLMSVLVICGLLFAANVLSARFLPELNRFLKNNGSLLYCSSAVLGLCLLSFESDIVTSYPASMLYSLAAGAGFTLVALIFYGLHDRLYSNDLPEAVRGMPMVLLTAALLSLAFGGFSGI